jgi:hypothetical protein
MKTEMTVHVRVPCLCQAKLGCDECGWTGYLERWITPLELYQAMMTAAHEQSSSTAG